MNATIDISEVVLKTERLLLRPWKDADLDDFFEYASVEGVGQMAGWLPHKNKEESKQILNGFIEGKKTFALERDGKVIGSLGIDEYNEIEMPEFDSMACREIGYVLSKDYWGQGLMPEAVREVIRYLFKDVKLDIVFCSNSIRNQQSARVKEKCGFIRHKRIEHEIRNGISKYSDFSLIRREDWIDCID